MLRAVAAFENEYEPKRIGRMSLIVGVLLCLASITFYWYGSYTFTSLEHNMATLPIFRPIISEKVSALLIY